MSPHAGMMIGALVDQRSCPRAAQARRAAGCGSIRDRLPPMAIAGIARAILRRMQPKKGLPLRRLLLARAIASLEVGERAGASTWELVWPRLTQAEAADDPLDGSPQG
jgi:hypothetical protein